MAFLKASRDGIGPLWRMVNVEDTFPIPSVGATVGRSLLNRVVIDGRYKNWRTVVPHHAHIYSLDEKWFIESLAAEEVPVLVNGSPVEAAPLRDGDRIQIGDVEFTFSTETDD